MTIPLKAIVTGHSRGLGAAIAEDFLTRGIPVLGCARGPHTGLGSRFPGLLSEAVLDLSDAKALASWLEGPALAGFCSAAETLVLVNNAGTLGPMGPSQTHSVLDVASAIQLNVATPMMLTSALARVHPGDLRILHISSGAGRAPYAGWSIYGATKAALDHHARAVVADRRASLRICSLAPGVIDTEMQTTIRATPETLFPMLEKFQRMKQEGHLTPPEEAARRLVAYTLGDDFGSAPVADLRELP